MGLVYNEQVRGRNCCVSVSSASDIVSSEYIPVYTGAYRVYTLYNISTAQRVTIII